MHRMVAKSSKAKQGRASKNAARMKQPAKKAKRARKRPDSSQDEDERFLALFDRLGRTKNPAERNKLADELARIIFGC